MQTPNASPNDTPRERVPALIVGGYAAFATLWAIVGGSGELPLPAIAIYAVIGAVAWWSVQASSRAAATSRDWLPFVALPFLYGLVPSTAGATVFRDAAVQQWDRALFGADAARELAGAMPWVAAGALLHVAYLSYYVIIYLPPLLLWWSERRGAFRLTALSFTIAMVVSLVGFLLIPVEGPRYVWPAPAHVPDEPARRLAVFLLERGSSRGTAFPSSHVAIAMAISLSCLSGWRRLGWAVFPMTVLLAIGAVYGGFHYAADVLAGAVVGIAAWVGARAVNS